MMSSEGLTQFATADVRLNLHALAAMTVDMDPGGDRGAM